MPPQRHLVPGDDISPDLRGLRLSRPSSTGRPLLAGDDISPDLRGLRRGNVFALPDLKLVAVMTSAPI